MLLVVDDPDAGLFNVPDAQLVDGKQVTVTTHDGLAFCRATLRACSTTAVALEARLDFAADDRFVFRDDAAVLGIAVRMRATEMRPEQAAFRKRVGDAWGWRCAITGDDVREVLEAAHLPGSNWRSGDNRDVDGILLRVDLHRLLDAGILRIKDGVVRVSLGSYAKYDGFRLQVKRDGCQKARLLACRPTDKSQV